LTILSIIAEMPGVIAVTPQIEGQVDGHRVEVNIGAVIRGVRWSDLAARRPCGTRWMKDDRRFRDEGGV
jgi:lipoprotein-releasing system permease protein